MLTSKNLQIMKYKSQDKQLTQDTFRSSLEPARRFIFDSGLFYWITLTDFQQTLFNKVLIK